MNADVVDVLTSVNARPRGTAYWRCGEAVLDCGALRFYVLDELGLMLREDNVQGK